MKIASKTEDTFMFDLQREIGARLKEVRLDRGLMQGQLAERCSISQSHLAGIEAGKVAASDRALAKFATVLGVRYAWLVRGELPRDQGDVSLLSDLLQSERLTADERSVLDEIVDTVYRAQRGIDIAGEIGDEQTILVKAFNCLSEVKRMQLLETVEKSFREEWKTIDWEKWRDDALKAIRRPWFAMVAYVQELKSDQKTETLEVKYKKRRGRPRKFRDELVPVRLIVDAAAGEPLLSMRQDSEIDVPKELVGDKQVVAVRARGKSMEKIGIKDGTVVLCRPLEGGFNYVAGDVVVCCIPASFSDGGFAIKRFGGTKKGIVQLYSENVGHSNLYFTRDKCRIEAVVTHRRTDEGIWVPVERMSVKGRR